MSVKKKKANSFHVTEQANMTMLSLTFTESGQNYELTSGIARDSPYTTNVRIGGIDLSHSKLFEPKDSFKLPVGEMPFVFIASMTGIVITMHIFSLYCWNSL